MGVAFEGIGRTYESFLSASELASTSEGYVGKVSANKTIDVCGDGEDFIGMIDDVGTDTTRVQTTGYATLYYSTEEGDTAPDLGLCPLTGAASGKVKKGVAGTNPFYRVVNKDTSAHTIIVRLG